MNDHTVNQAEFRNETAAQTREKLRVATHSDCNMEKRRMFTFELGGLNSVRKIIADGETE